MTTPPKIPRAQTLTHEEKEAIGFRVWVEEKVKQINKRLDKGVETFAEMRAELARVDPAKLIGRMWWVIGVALVSAGVTWGTLSSTKTDRDEVYRIVQDSSPYRFDKQKIERVIDRYDADQEKIKNDLSAIRAKLEELDGKISATPPRSRRRR